jgi:DNA primase
VRVQLRALDLNHLGRKVKAGGGGGVFATRRLAEALRQGRVAVVEAPVDALSLTTAGVDAVAVGGSFVPEWLVEALGGNEVLLGFDNDVPDRSGRRAGDAAAERLADQLWDAGPEPNRARPSLKDWNDVLRARGREGVWLGLPS